MTLGAQVSLPTHYVVALALLATVTACAGSGVNTPRQAPKPSSSNAPGAGAFELLAGGAAGFADGRGTAARFREPNGVDSDSAGNLYVADTGNHRIRKIAPDGTVTTVAGRVKGFKDGPAGEAQFDSPYGVALNRDGTVYVADTKNHRIRAIAPDGQVRTVAGGDGPGDRDGAAADARFNQPFAVVLDALDGVLVADTGNHRIRRLDPSGVVETLAGHSPGYVDGAASESRFSGPSDIGIDPRGRIYVADLRNHAIRQLDPVAGQVRTVAGNGVAGYADGSDDDARFNLPTGLAVSAAGGVYVADSQNRALRLIGADGRVTTVMQTVGETNSAGPTPIDVWADGRGTLFVTDAVRHALLRSL